MIIHFGLHLDGMQPAPPRTALGETALGPGRFLALLESQLGLPPVATRPGEALLAYRACLEEVDGPDRFYHHSLATDSLGTARTLLGWRARWHEAGWRGRFEAPVSKRLADMADVERLAAARVPLDSGQRVARVAAALDSGLATQIERVVLHDEPAALPPGWRALLERFACEIASGVGPAARAVPGTDLHRVQQRLLALDDAAPHETRPHETQSRETQPRETLRRETLPLDLAGDGSLLIVRAVSRDLSAQSIAEYLRESGAADETVLVAERDGIIVDNALERVGLPRAGFQHYSRFRAVTQVLKLCLGLVWEPVSPQLLLQFLLHPVAPLPTHARSALAEAVAKEPGVGGRAWRETLREILDRLRERAESENRSDFAAQGAALQADVAYWLEAERYSPAQGAPVAALVERAQRCTTWLAGRLNAGVADRKERDLYGAAVAQGEALIGVLADLAASGRDTIDRLTLERLLDEVTGAAPDPGTFAEAHHVRGATQPAAITRPWDTVIWWDLREQRLHDGHVWSETELAELAAEGVALPSPAERIRVESRAWRRPILCARSRAILVVHDRDEGRHPLVIQLESLARGFKETRVEEALLADGAARISGLGVSTEPLPRKALPAARRWWRLPPASKVPPREQESYSSLQKLLYYPHEWVLGYAGRLRAGRAANLARGNLLYGNLAHRLFETYFEEHPDRAHRTACDLDRWVAAALPSLMRREAAVLMEPGMGVTREAVASTLEHALAALLRHLESANIEHVAAEAAHAVPFKTLAFDGEPREVALCGAIDLLLVDAAGREIVVDVKWGGEDRRGEELAQNRSLQLATYSYLRYVAGAGARMPISAGRRGARRRSAERNLELALELPRRWPEQAYFIVTTGNILARDTRVFPDAVVFAPETAESTERLWARIGRSIDWRWAQLSAGDIEVNARGTQPDEGSAAPDDALAVQRDPDGYDDFTWLTGWEEGA